MITKTIRDYSSGINQMRIKFNFMKSFIYKAISYIVLIYLQPNFTIICLISYNLIYEPNNPKVYKLQTLYWIIPSPWAEFTIDEQIFGKTNKQIPKFPCK